MVYVNHEVAVQPQNIQTVKTSTSINKPYDIGFKGVSNAKTNAYAPSQPHPRPQNLQPHEQRKTSSAINANALGDAYAKPIIIPTPVAPPIYGHNGVPQTQIQTQSQANTAFQSQAMQFNNVNPPYVPPPQMHMDLTDFQSRPLYSTKDFAFQPISKCLFWISDG